MRTAWVSGLRRVLGATRPVPEEVGWQIRKSALEAHRLSWCKCAMTTTMIPDEARNGRASALRLCGIGKSQRRVRLCPQRPHVSSKVGASHNDPGRPGLLQRICSTLPRSDAAVLRLELTASTARRLKVATPAGIARGESDTSWRWPRAHHRNLESPLAPTCPTIDNQRVGLPEHHLDASVSPARPSEAFKDFATC